MSNAVPAVTLPERPATWVVPPKFGREFGEQQQGLLASPWAGTVGLALVTAGAFLGAQGLSKALLHRTFSVVGMGPLKAAGVAAALVATADAASGHQLSAPLSIALQMRHEIGVALKHPLQPWFAPVAYGTFGSAKRATSREIEHPAGAAPVDGARDAFQHTYASMLLTVRFVNRGMSIEDAVRAVQDIGRAHEAGARRGPNDIRSYMDDYNNAVGLQLAVELLASGRAEPSEDDVRIAVRDAVETGRMLKANADGTDLVPTVADDLQHEGRSA